jgi:hypothetical protein
MHTPSPKIKEDIEFLKVLNDKQFLEKPRNWSNRDIEITATNASGLKPRQGFLPSDLQTLHFDLWNTHNLTPKIWEDMTFQRLLNVKPSSRNLSGNGFIELCLDPWNKYFPSSRIFVDLYTYRTSFEEHFLFWKCGLIQLQLILTNFRLSLIVHNTQGFENSNFLINFK